MKKIRVLVMAVACVLILSKVGVMAADNWKVIVSNQKFTFTGEESNVNALNINDTPSSTLKNTNISDGITSDNVYITKITPGEAICIAKVAISDDASYAIELSEESGGALFTALNQTDDVILSNGATWHHMSMRESPFTATIPLPLSNLTDEDDLLTEGVYYLYVGSFGDELTNANISIVGSGSNAKIELMK